jgi:hypothetical protein
MKIFINLPSDGTLYVPVPKRGIVKAMDVVWQTNAVEPNDTVIASRNTTAVNTCTAVDTAGQVVEHGVPDTTNKDLVFDPVDDTDLNQMIKLVANGAAGVSIVMIEFDVYATVVEDPILE